MQMPLAVMSNERQLWSQAMKVSEGIFLSLLPLCLVVTKAKLDCTVSQALLCGYSFNMGTSL